MIDIDDFNENDRKAIEELRGRVKNILKPCILEDTVLFYRFLKARDFDVKEAESMLQKHITWRKLFQIDTILEDFTPREFFLKYIEPTILGFDKEGSLVVFEAAGDMDGREVERCVEMHILLKYWAWFIEKMLKHSKDHGKISKRNYTPILFIMDMEKLTLGNAVYKRTGELYFNVLNMFQNNYPEYMKGLYVINAPAYAQILYTLVRPIISNHMAEKIEFFGYDGWKEKLLEVIDADVLPEFLGGNRTDPDGDPLCKTFVNHGGRIPPKYYLSDEERYFKNRSGVKKITVPKMDKREIIVDVNELNSIIQWEFYVKNNINFGLFRRISDEPPEEVIPLFRHDTSDGTEKDSYKVRIPGKYIIVFDNSYSWMTSKDVEYCIQIKRPES